MVNELDYYEILEVKRGASDAEIKRSFRRLAQKWHPDVNTDAGADERFKALNEAYQVLSDPAKTQAYDLFGRAGVCWSRGRAGAGDFAGFGDIFDAFFGGAAGGRPANRARGRGRPALRPADHLRRGDPGHREGDRVQRARSLPDVCGLGRQAGHVERHLPRSATAGASCARSATRCWARWST